MVETESTFPVGYHPDGVESDDDEGSCANPHKLVELVIDDSFLDLCTEATNEHAAEDAPFIKEIGIIKKSEKGRAFMKGLLAVKWHLSLLGYSQKQWAWNEDPFKHQTEIKKVMTYLQFQLMAKHVRMTKPSEMPRKGSPSYHPLQNILSGVDYLRRKSASLWIPGKRMCLDEGKVVSKSDRNVYKTRNPDKSIRMGWMVNKLADKGKKGGYFVYNHLTKVGKYTYTDATHGKNYNAVEQLIHDVKGMGKTVTMDSGFPTLKLLKDAMEYCNCCYFKGKRSTPPIETWII